MPEESNPYVLSSPAPASNSKNPLGSVKSVLENWGKKASEATKKVENLAGNMWQPYWTPRPAGRPDGSQPRRRLASTQSSSQPAPPCSRFKTSTQRENFQTLPFIQSLVEKDLDKKDMKKKGGVEKVKKPAPAYFLKCKDQWNEVKKANPNADFKEVSNILGAKWKMSRRRKLHWSFLNSICSSNKKLKRIPRKPKLKEKDHLKPKQPMYAFFVFNNERRADLLGERKNILEISKITGEELKNMTQQQKKPYEEWTKENKDKYLKEMEIYKQRKEEEESNMKRDEDEHMKLQKVETLQLLKKKEKTEKIIKKAKDMKKKQPKEEKMNDPNKPKRPLLPFVPGI